MLKETWRPYVFGHIVKPVLADEVFLGQVIKRLSKLLDHQLIQLCRGLFGPISDLSLQLCVESMHFQGVGFEVSRPKQFRHSCFD